MPHAPLDLAEWLDWLWLHVCRYPSSFPQGSDDFAREASEICANDMAHEYWSLVDDLNDACPEDKDYSEAPDKALEWLVERNQLLEEIEDTLQKAEFDGVPIKGAADEALGIVLAELEGLRAELAALKAPETTAEALGLEYDL